jgi:8-amino-7-oxononanoate synthase
MKLLEKFSAMAGIRAELAGLGIRPFGAVTEKLLSSTEAIVDGRHVILAGTNNYLGLTFDPDCIAAAQQALAEQGTGTTGSRMANGTFAEHVALEQELLLLRTAACDLFSTGFSATLGMGACRRWRRSDARCRQPCQHLVSALGGADHHFRHNDVENLE